MVVTKFGALRSFFAFDILYRLCRHNLDMPSNMEIFDRDLIFHELLYCDVEINEIIRLDFSWV